LKKNDPDPFLLLMDPDPYLLLMDPDQGGPKTCGSGGSEFGSGTLLSKEMVAKEGDGWLRKEDGWLR
jgi:hypothetical protein